MEANASDADIKSRISALITEEFMIASDTPGIQLYVRNKRPSQSATAKDRVLLYVHGATYPASTAFDLALDGMSWMDYIAAQGGRYVVFKDARLCNLHTNYRQPNDFSVSRNK
jgi:hypothetical protein